MFISTKPCGYSCMSDIFVPRIGWQANWSQISAGMFQSHNCYIVTQEYCIPGIHFPCIFPRLVNVNFGNIHWFPPIISQIYLDAFRAQIRPSIILHTMRGSQHMRVVNHSTCALANSAPKLHNPWVLVGVSLLSVRNVMFYI